MIQVPGNNEQSKNSTTPNVVNESEDTVFYGDSAEQSKDEFELDKKGDHTADDDKVTTGGSVDDLLTNSDGAASTDRAGTTERKKYGDPELNKGLESQAKDEEGSNL